jgi:arylsulfatase A-like enzyme
MKQQIIYSAIAITGLYSCSNKEQTDNKKPNIVILFSDELELDMLSCYGGEVSTPALDSLAAHGMRFTRAYVPAAASTPSRYALLTGKFPGSCRHSTFRENNPDSVPYRIEWNTFLAKQESTIADIFNDAGYFTGMVGKWHLAEYNDLKGLPEIDPDESLDGGVLDERLAKHQKITQEYIKNQAGFQFVGNAIIGNNERNPVKELKVHHMEWMTHGAVRFIDTALKHNKPFLLYAATTCIHGPGYVQTFRADPRKTPEGLMDEHLKYHPDRKAFLDSIKDYHVNYQGRLIGLSLLDHHVKAVMDKLKEEGLLDNTIVIFLADHNREPGKTTCYNTGVHVPMIVSWPKNIKPGSVCDAMVESTDLLPTVMDAAGIQPIDELFGKSLLPLLAGDTDKLHEYVFYEFGYQRAIFDGRYKYIATRFPESVKKQFLAGELEYAPNHLDRYMQAHAQIALEYHPGYFAPDQLYDLENDFYEQENLAYEESYKGKLDSLQNRLKEHTEMFSNIYPWNSYKYMLSDEYRHLVEKTKQLGTSHISWWNGMQWPPDTTVSLKEGRR